MISSALRPTHLSKYELEEEIGHGGMATVYRARDLRLERDVALKLLHPHLRQNLEVRVRFASEARAVAKLRHPNIVEVFDVSEDDEDERYLVVELVKGITLRQLLKEQPLLPVELAAEIALEVACALEHAHEQGVIHRDIKPENVLLEMPRAGARSSVDDFERARVKLTDFGIAKLMDVDGVTSTGQVLGSPAHMAPEQIEGRAVDGRADVFSLGVMFYECIAGQLPFAGKNPAQVLRNVLEGSFAAADTLEPRVGSRWSAIVAKALQREPGARFQTVAELGAALRRELNRVGFDKPRQDITEFLLDRQGYIAAFPDRIVAALGVSAKLARHERDAARASADFSRALVYRPGDQALLSAVSQIRTRGRLQKSAVLGAAAVVSVSLAMLLWPQPSTEDTPAQTVTSGPLPAPTPTPVAVPVPEGSAALRGENGSPLSQASSKPRAATPPVARRNPRPTPSATTGQAPAGETRQVSIRITGAGGGSVKIDGALVPWFGVVHEVPVGPHAFEFIPPNDSCCLATRRTIDVPPGEGVHVVVGSIPFKNASFSVRTPEGEGWTVSCPTLFAGQLTAPARRSIPMSQAEVTGSCMISSPVEGSSAVQKVVTLRAGQTTTLPWP